MKVLAINSSPRKEGNTSILLSIMSEVLKQESIDVEVFQLPAEPIRGCTACRTCFQNKDMQCIIKNDCINEVVQKLNDSDGLILGSPTYFADVNAEMKAIIDRVGYVNKANGNFLKRKVGCGISAVRRGGANRVFDTFNHFFFINEMIVPGSTYWNFVFGREIGEVKEDTEGIKNMENLAANMAWLMKKTQ